MRLFYTGINNFMHRHSFIKSCVHFLSQFCPYMVGIFFTLFVLKLYIEYPSTLYMTIVKPCSCFLLTALLKFAFNRQRPGEKYNFTPIDDRIRIGNSMPSIHVAVSVSMALTVMRYGPNMSLLLITLAITITLTRILTGNHYISDCLVGGAIAYAIQLI